MILRIAAIILRVSGILSLILGLLFWSGHARNLVQSHILIGTLLVVCLWVVGIGQAFSAGGSWPLAIAALLIGMLALYIGMRQSMLLSGPFHWVIQVVHLLLGVLAVGIGQISMARYQKRAMTIQPPLTRLEDSR